MLELYKIADKLLAELKGMRKSGVDERKLQVYIKNILGYLQMETR